MHKFCRIFESEKYGQILVMVQNNSKGLRSIYFYIDPDIEGIPTCNLNFIADDDKTKEDISEYIDKLGIESAEFVAENILNEIQEEIKNQGDV